MAQSHDKAPKKPRGVRRDAPIPEHDAFTREQIMEARKGETRWK